MGWSIGYDSIWNRDIGYGVPAYCDHPDCNEEINRGLGYVCGTHPYGGEHGCGLFFCGAHMHFSEEAQLCEKCLALFENDPNAETNTFIPKPEHPTWLAWKLSDESWEDWRKENPAEVERYRRILFDV